MSLHFMTAVIFCLKVASEASVDDSSCTPHLRGVAPQTPIRQNVWIGQSGFQQLPGGVYNAQQIGMASQTNNDNLGAGIETLLHNIGRGGVFSGALRTQNSLGSDNSFGPISGTPVQAQTPMNGSPLAFPVVGASPVSDHHSPHQMNISTPTHHPFGPASAQLAAGGMQDLWSSLVQNPQLLNVAVSMGLLQNPNPALQTMPSTPNQALLANMLANLGGAQQNLQQGVQYPNKVDMGAVSESIVSDALGQSPIQIVYAILN